MSYYSRLYNHRNAQPQEAQEKKPFFSKSKDASGNNKKGAFFQAKLAVGQPGDKYEKQADAVAGKVVQRLSTDEEKNMPATNDGRMAEDKRIQEKSMIQMAQDEKKEKDTPAVQRAAAAPKEEEKPVQKMAAPEKKEEKPIQKSDAPEKKEEKPIQKSAAPEKKEEKPIQKMDAPKKEEEKPIQKQEAPKKEEEKPVQKKDASSPSTASPGVTAQLESSSGKGRPLPQKTMREMSTSIGADFKDVRIHDDSEAVSMNEELQAHAFTHGKDVYFNRGKFDPNSSQGKFLLAHELTHVVQQGAAGESIQRERTTGESIQRDLAIEPSQPNVAEPALTPAKMKEAIDYNRDRYGHEATLLIQDIVGAGATGVMDEDTIRLIALYQAQNGMQADGMVGPNTFDQLTSELTAEGASQDTCLNMFLVNVQTPMELHAAAAPNTANIFGNFSIEIRFSPHCDCSRFEYRQFIGGDVTLNGVNINNRFGQIPGGALPGLGNFIEDGNNTVAGNGRLGYRNTQPNLAAQNEYLDTSGNIDMLNGCIYRSFDQPGLTNAQANPGDVYDFNIRFFGDIRKDGKMIERKFWSVRERIVIP